MKRVFYMDFVGSVNGKSLDKVGGLPTHIPDEFPVSAVTGNQLGFLMQIYCDGERLEIKDTLCIQLYQSIEINEGDDSTPIVVKVLNDAELNTGMGTVHPDVDEYSINWIEDEEPDILPYNLGLSSGELKMLQSKLKGAVPAEYAEEGRANLQFLGWIAELPVDFNFAGMLTLLLDSENNILLEII